MGERMRHRQSAGHLLETVDALEGQINQALDAAARAHDEGERVSLLVAELLLGVQAHLNSGKESLQVVRSTLQAGMREPE